MHASQIRALYWHDTFLVLSERYDDRGDWTVVDYRRGRDKCHGYKGPQNNNSRNRYYQPDDRHYYNGQRFNDRQYYNPQRFMTASITTANVLMSASISAARILTANVLMANSVPTHRSHGPDIGRTGTTAPDNITKSQAMSHNFLNP
ncbi:hypothetical protein NQZ68_024839, partial [Dissostichus eleginoides]